MNVRVAEWLTSWVCKFFSCKKCPGKHARHILLNDAAWRSLQRAQIQAQKEPGGLAVTVAMQGSNGTSSMKRPDGASLIPWKRGRSVAWDVTASGTFARSSFSATSGVGCRTLGFSQNNEIFRDCSKPHFCPVSLWSYWGSVCWGDWFPLRFRWSDFRCHRRQTGTCFSLSAAFCCATKRQRSCILSVSPPAVN